jgi:hypothetical protein
MMFSSMSAQKPVIDPCCETHETIYTIAVCFVSGQTIVTLPLVCQISFFHLVLCTVFNASYVWHRFLAIQPYEPMSSSV